MRIGFDYRLGGVEHAGLGRYSQELLFGLLKNCHDLEITVFYKAGQEQAEDVERLKEYKQVSLVPVSARHYSVSEQTIFLHTLKKHPVGLVHFPNFNIPYFYHKPYVVTIHDVVHHKLSGHKKSTYLHFLAYKKIIERAAQKSQAIITVSEQSKLDISKMLRVPEEKIKVIYEAASLVPVSENVVAEVKKRYLLHKPYFLFVGTLERKKNLVTLARGFNLFLEKTKLDMDLVVAGKPDKHYPDVKHHILDIPHKDRIVLTGFVTDEEIAALYQGAHAYVSASPFEGFGLPGVEAMSFGIPLIVANTPVYNEVYDNAALYFDYNNIEDIADQLALLASDTKFHVEQQQKSLARSKFFDWDTTAKQTYEVYKKILL